MSRAFMDRAVRFKASDDPDEATAQTVDVMVRLIGRSASDPMVKRCADTALRQYAGGGPLWAMRGVNPFAGDRVDRARAVAESVWWYAKHQLRFVHHATQIDVWLNERDQLQLLIEPSVLVRFPFRMEGDCAIYTMLISAMLECLGVGFEIVTAAVDPSQPNIFSHVWPRAVLPNGARIALDASHGRMPGWSVPLDRRYRVQVWDKQGFPIQDSGEQRFNGLHGYTLRRGFGDAASDAADASALNDAFTGNSDSSTQLNLPGGLDLSQTFAPSDYSTQPLATGPAPVAGSTPGYVVPSQNSAQWASFANSLLKSGMTLAEINAIQPGTVVSANGAILRQAPGLPVPVGSPLGSSITAAFGSMSMGTVVLIGGGLLLAVFMFKGK